MLLELAYPVVSTEMPMLPSFTRRPKLLWLDTGIINYAAQIRKFPQSEVFGLILKTEPHPKWILYFRFKDCVFR